MKRSRQQISYEILQICRNGASKTAIAKNVNINFKTATLYLQILVKNHLIEVVSGEYLSTQKGIHLLESINRVNKQLFEENKTEPVSVEG
jgi:predicted transcriptional regulator